MTRTWFLIFKESLNMGDHDDRHEYIVALV